MSGRACNVSADCDGRGEVCLVPSRDQESCAVVTGTCAVGECGNDDDCDDGCCNLSTKQCGQSRDECAATPECESQDDCSSIERCRSGVCRVECEDDVDCPGSERCSVTCEARIGAACSIDAGFGECFGGDCVDRDVRNELTTA